MRLDKYLTEKFGSRTKAAEAILREEVKVNGKAVNPSYNLKESDEITFEEALTFVSNGGYKLEKALTDFNFSVTGKVIADIGASNGGFTDCLFKHGAEKVYCVDVGESQLDESLKSKNIVIIDNFNARNLTSETLGCVPDGATVDVSFISLTYILDKLALVLPNGGFILALIKPQFECEKRDIGKGGIVKSPQAHRAAIYRVCEFAIQFNLAPVNLTNAPIIQDKNKEYVVLLKKNAKPVAMDILIKNVKL